MNEAENQRWLCLKALPVSEAENPPGNAIGKRAKTRGLLRPSRPAHPAVAAHRRHGSMLSAS